MPITVSDKITVSELRQRIGGVSDDKTSHGLTDSELQDIIDQEEEALINAYESKKSASDFDVIPSFLVEAVDVSVDTTSPDTPLLADGDITGDYESIPKTAIDADTGKELSFDPQIHSTARRSNLFTRYRYFVDEATVYVTPSTITDVTLWLPPSQTLFDTLMAAEVANFNQRVVEKAAQMAQRTKQEGAYIEQDGLHEQGIENDQ